MGYSREIKAWQYHSIMREANTSHSVCERWAVQRHTVGTVTTAITTTTQKTKAGPVEQDTGTIHITMKAKNKMNKGVTSVERSAVNAVIISLACAGKVEEKIYFTDDEINKAM